MGNALNKKKAEHQKEKERKLAMLKEYPHLAKEIWQSIEDQDARYHADFKNLGDAFKKAGEDFQRAVTPAPRKPSPRHGAAIVRTGLSIANKLIKK
jgi:molecular chaperone GrpE (heat shock protein)